MSCQSVRLCSQVCQSDHLTCFFLGLTLIPKPSLVISILPRDRIFLISYHVKVWAGDCFLFSGYWLVSYFSLL